MMLITSTGSGPIGRYPCDTNYSSRSAVGRGGVTGAEQATQKGADAFDSNASVDCVGGRRRNVTRLRSCVVVADWLENWSNCRYQHVGEHRNAEWRHAPHPYTQFIVCIPLRQLHATLKVIRTLSSA